MQTSCRRHCQRACEIIFRHSRIHPISSLLISQNTTISKKRFAFSSTNTKQNHTTPKPSTTWNIPNLLTLGRIAVTPYLSYLILNYELEKAVGVFMLAGVSDWLDGHIARKYNQKTTLGSFLDPMADKIMVTVLSVTMAYQGLLPVPLVSLMIGRDILLVAGTLIHRIQTKSPESSFFSTNDVTSFKIKPTLLSKVNTGLQFTLISLALVNGTWLLPGDEVMYGLSWLVGSTTFISGLQYARIYLQEHSVLVATRKKKSSSS